MLASRPNMFFLIISSLLLLPASALASAKLAETGSFPDSKKRIALTKGANGEELRIRSEWNGSFLGLVFGKMEVDYQAKNGIYNGFTAFRTAGIASFLLDDKYRIEVNGYLHPDNLVPYNYKQEALNKRKQRVVQIERREDEIRYWATPAYGDLGEPPASKTQVAQAHDPVSAILALTFSADRDIDKPCDTPLRVFDGKQRYDLRLKQVGYDKNYESKAYKGGAFRCHLEFVKVAGFDKEAPTDRARRDTSLRGAVEITVADMRDKGLTPPIKISAKTKWGRVNVYVRRLHLELAGK